MIESLNGLQETVNFKERKAFRLYDNTDCEEYPAHWHAPLELIMPLRETYTVIIKDAKYVLGVGDIMIINSGVIHQLLAQKNGERLIFQTDFSLLQSIGELESMLTIISPAIVITGEKDPDIHGQVSAIMHEIYAEYFGNRPFSEVSIYSMLLEILVLVGRKYSTRTDNFDVTYGKQQEYLEKFTNVCNYINEHCTEDLTLDGVAEICSFSKFHFARLFKQFTGHSFYRYLNRKRIERAEKYLIDPEMSVTEIALKSGFSSLAAFTRMFKLIQGCTPTEFRNMYNS